MPGSAGVRDCLRQFPVDGRLLIGQLGDALQRRRIDLDQTIGLNALRPGLELRKLRAVSTCCHFVHQPFRNFARALIA